MAATVEAVYGLLHEMKNGVDKIASNASAHKVPRSTGGKRPHEEVDTDVDHSAGESSGETSPRKLFNDQFRRSQDTAQRGWPTYPQRLFCSIGIQRTLVQWVRVMSLLRLPTGV